MATTGPTYEAAADDVYVTSLSAVSFYFRFSIS